VPQAVSLRVSSILKARIVLRVAPINRAVTVVPLKRDHGGRNPALPSKLSRSIDHVRLRTGNRACNSGAGSKLHLPGFGPSELRRN
jgi:hypothetical protein